MKKSKKKEVSRVLSGTLATSLAFNPIGGVISTVMADVLDNSVDNIVKLKNSQAIKDSMYLTDLDYISDLSYSNNGVITNNANKDDSEISLSVDGKVKDFKHGLGVGVDSEVVYDISEYSSKFNILSVFVGIDDRELSDEKVRFLIYSSDDGDNWQPLYQTDFMSRLDDSIYISANIEGVKYLKLFTKGENENPDIKAVYGDIRLLQTDVSAKENKGHSEKVSDNEINSMYEGVSVLSSEGVQAPRSSSFATFSFDGVDAGKIIITDDTLVDGIEMRYSLDKGVTWKTFIGREFTLSQEEIDSITAENDIYVGVAKNTGYAIIDILVGDTISAKEIYKNDVENRFYGKIQYLQVSTDGVNWKDYDTTMSFNGSVVVHVRYKAHGVYAMGKQDRFTFSADSTSATKSVVPSINIINHEACSEQNATSFSSANMVDGNGYTSWMSNARTDESEELYYTVQFDTIRYITELDYLPYDMQKGRLKSGKIYASYDGEEWELLHTFSNLGNSTSSKNIKFDRKVFTRYIKIVATETYADGQSSSASPNVYFSGKMLTFYEDTTVKYNSEPTIVYSTTNETKNYVIATLMLPEGCTATEKTHKFLTNGDYTFYYKDKDKVEREIKAEVRNIVRDENENSIFLTDINYESSSFAGWNGIRYNKSPVGGTIGLLIDGVVATFNKGIGAHADSELVYDVEALVGTYSRFSSYVGVDSSRKNTGSVKFIVYGSTDGTTWKDLYTSGVLAGDNPAELINVSIAGYKYIKLRADGCGSTSEDHAVYGSPRLIKEGYDINSEKVSGLLQVSEYDAQIKAKHEVGTEMTEEVKRLVMLREFVNRFGYSNLKQYGEASSSNKEAIEYILNNNEVLSLFLEAGTLEFGTGANSVKAWCSIYEKHKSDLMNVMHRKIMIATSVALSRNIQSFMTSWGGNYRYSNPLLRYELMKKLYDDKRFLNYNQFDSLPMELIRAVVDARLGDDEVLWLRNYTEYRYSDTSKRFNPYNFVAYRSPNYGGEDLRDPNKYKEWSDKYLLEANGVLDYGAVNMPKIWMEVERGSICWGISGFGSATNEVHGIPSINIYQPGHEAYLVYSENKEGKGIWSIGNNVGSWANSYTRWAGFSSTFSRMLLSWGNRSYISDTKNNGSYVLLSQAALNDYEHYKEAMFYNFLAKVYEGDANKQISIYNQALEIQSFNFDSLEGLINAYNKLGDKSSSDWLELAKRVITEYTYYPVPMVDLLGQIKGHISEELDIATLDILKTDALVKASNATSAVSLQPDACKTVAKSLLGKETTYLATFSFDGDDAGKIVLNEKYREYTVRVRYSLDGGKNFTESDNQVIQLSQEELAKINPTDDLVVGLVGTKETYTIDILAGNNLGNDIYANDNENLLLGGNLANLEYSIDGGLNWNDYDGSGVKSTTKIEGTVSAQFRYKAYGVHVSGGTRTYNFTANTDKDTSKYLELRNVELYEFSSQQSTTINHAAVNFIDGTPNTAWHTKFNTPDDKFYSVKFDQVRYINKLTYMAGGSVNGRLKAGQIYTSMDGKNWTLVHTFSGLKNVTTVQTIDFGKNVEARYLKIVATENYGNTDAEAAMYFSGKMLNFYEDATQVYKANVSVDYSTTAPTNGSVKATLVLPEGCEAIEKSEHIFENNDTFEFRYTDANGKEHTIIAEVKNIDRDLPIMEYEFDKKDATNEDVTMTITGFSKEETRVIDVNENPSEEEIKEAENWGTATPSDEVGSVDVDNDESDLVDSGESSVETLSESEENVDTGFNVYPNTYVFKDNKTVIFTIQDIAGNINKIPVTVNWIDREAPKFVIEYDNEEPTYGSVTAKIVGVQEDEEIISVGGDTHVFTKNGEFEFIVKDKAGNETKKVARVTWIRENSSDKDNNIDPDFGIASEDEVDTSEKDNNIDPDFGIVSEDEIDTSEKDDNIDPDFGIESEDEIDVSEKDENIDPDFGVEVVHEFSVTFNKDTWTNENVVATLEGLQYGDEIISDGGYTHEFTQNGKFVFKVKDVLGKIYEVPVEVKWIDKVAPTAKIIYDTTKLSEGKVVAKIDSFSEEEVTLLGDKLDYYEFSKNGSYTFKFVDKAGNEGSVVANVDWIVEKEDISTLVKYENIKDDIIVDESTKEDLDYVLAVVTVDTDKVEIINNGGSSEIKFVKNGVFALRARMIDTDEEFDILVEVNWLSDTAEEGESPVELPENDTTCEKDPNIDENFGVESTDDKDIANGDANVDEDFGMRDPSTSDKDDNIDPDFGIESDSDKDIADQYPDVDENFGVDSDSDKDIANGDANVDEDFGMRDPSTSEKDENIDEGFGIESEDDKDVSDKEDNIDPDFGVGSEEDNDTSEKDENIDPDFGVESEDDKDTSEKDENIDPDFGVDYDGDNDTSDKDENIDPDFGVESEDDKDIANGDSNVDEGFGVVPPVVEETPVTPPVTTPDNGNNGGNTSNGGGSNNGSSSGGSSGGSGTGGSDGTTSEKDENIDPNFGVESEDDKDVAIKPNEDEVIDEGFLIPDSVLRPAIPPIIGSVLGSISNSSSSSENMDSYIESFRDFISSTGSSNTSSSDSKEDTSTSSDKVESDSSSSTESKEDVSISNSSTNNSDVVVEDNSEHSKGIIEVVVDAVSDFFQKVSKSSLTFFQKIAKFFGAALKKF